MSNQHPITPPPELVRQWREESSTGELHFSPQYIATQAARWGADQELQACCEQLDELQLGTYYPVTGGKLRTARRPKPPSLKEQALAALQDDDIDVYLIRRALEALPND